MPGDYPVMVSPFPRGPQESSHHSPEEEGKYPGNIWMSAEHNWEGLFPGHTEQDLQNPLPKPKVFPGGSVVKNPPDNAGDTGSTSGSGRSPGGGNGNPLRYSCLGNPMDRKAWRATVHGATKNWAWLSTHAQAQAHSPNDERERAWGRQGTGRHHSWTQDVDALGKFIPQVPLTTLALPGPLVSVEDNSLSLAA